MLTSSFVLLSCLLTAVSGVASPSKRQDSGKRIPFTAKPASKAAPDDFDFQNSQNGASLDAQDIYIADLTVGGKKFEVQVDTGSSDLWLDTTGVDVSGFTKTGQTGSLTYGDGTVAQGPILVGNVTLGSFSFGQAFISAPGTNATTNGDTGLMGVGPPTLSVISQELNTTTFNGKTVIENVFAANPNDPKLITFQLSRSETTGKTSGGVFTIGELDSDFSGISNAPKLPVLEPDRWVVAMDGIKVNGGSLFNGHSAFNVQGQQTGQTLANLDSGTGLAQIPQAYADAIYQNVPGAKFSSSDGLYIVPCNSVIQLSFVFGGQEFPVHPIDTVMAAKSTSGGVICVGAFQPANGETEDFLLGDSFLRNVYSVFNFGAFISGTDAPSIQLLSTTDATKAASEFNSLSSQRNATLTGSKGSSSGSSSGGSNASTRSIVQSSSLLVSALLMTAATFFAL